MLGLRDDLGSLWALTLMVSIEVFELTYGWFMARLQV